MGSAPRRRFRYHDCSFKLSTAVLKNDSCTNRLCGGFERCAHMSSGDGEGGSEITDVSIRYTRRHTHTRVVSEVSDLNMTIAALVNKS